MFPPSIRNKARIIALIISTQHCPGSWSVQEGKKKKGKKHTNWLYSNMVRINVCVETLKESSTHTHTHTPKLPEFISELNKATEFKVNIQKSIVFSYQDINKIGT